MGRYKDQFGIVHQKNSVKLKTISIRETDLYVTFNSMDRLDLLSYRIYGDSTYWWIILMANGYGIEFDIEVGEVLRIPSPLSEVLREVSV